MKIRYKRKKGMLVLLAAAVMAAAGCGSADTLLVSPVLEKQVLTVDQKGYTLQKAKVYLLNYQNLYGKLYGADLWRNGAGDGSLEAYVKELSVSQMIKILSMDSLAASRGVELDEKDCTNAAKAARIYYDSLNDAEKQYLDIERNEIEELYEDYILAQKMYRLLTKEINAEVSDDEARIMEAMQIYVTNAAAAEEVGAALENGGDFASLANSYNEAAEVSIQLGRGELPAEVEQAAFALGNGETSACIRTDQGYYFIHCINKFNEELTDLNKENIVRRREKEAFGDVYDAYSATLKRSIDQSAWDAVEVSASAAMQTDSFFADYDNYCGD